MSSSWCFEDIVRCMCPTYWIVASLEEQQLLDSQEGSLLASKRRPSGDRKTQGTRRARWCPRNQLQRRKPRHDPHCLYKQFPKAVQGKKWRGWESWCQKRYLFFERRVLGGLQAVPSATTGKLAPASASWCVQCSVSHSSDRICVWVTHAFAAADLTRVSALLDSRCACESTCLFCEYHGHEFHVARSSPPRVSRALVASMMASTRALDVYAHS